MLAAESTDFEHFFVKNKFRDVRATAFDALRELLENKNFKEIRKVSDKEEQQVMVIRVIQKVENSLNVFLIEDEDSQAKIYVKEGFLWIGMIAAIEARWVDGQYQLSRVIDLSQPLPSAGRVSNDLEAYRVLFVKGPFRTRFKGEDEGILVITNEIKRLRKFNMNVSCVVLMGPVLSKENKEVKDCTLKMTYEEEYEAIIQQFRSELSKLNSNMELYILPSTEDVVSLYPIPQAPYQPESNIEGAKFLSNPARMTIRGRASHCKINLVNYDLLKYIDTFKAGKATKDVRAENLETYLKQPFLLNNTMTDDPFDEVNMGALYNGGDFGDLVVFSSVHSPPFVNVVDGRIVLNIGSLGVDYNFTASHYMALVSIYEGEGRACERVKI